MNLKMRKNYVAVEKTSKKSSSQNTSVFFVEPETTDHLGLIVAIGPDVKDLKPGDKVYYGPRLETMRCKGREVLMMEEENVYGVSVEDEQNQQ